MSILRMVRVAGAQALVSSALAALALSACDGAASGASGTVIVPAMEASGGAPAPVMTMMPNLPSDSSHVLHDAMSSGAGGAASTTPPMMGAGGAASMPMHDHGGMAGGGAMDPLSQCKLQVSADARDAMLTNEPQTIDAGFTQDNLMPQIVLDWMDENQFAEAHDGWHLVRKWDQTCRVSNAPDDCASAANLKSQGLSRAPIQQGAPGDGVAFMMMHRHMIMMLKTAFPTHPELFDGFTKVPRTSDDPANPQPWHEISWTPDNITGFDTLENIEQHLDQFATDDDLGQYIENTYRWTTTSPMSPVNAPGSGLHGALHSQWSVFGSPANLIEQAVDVKNYAFWKLHGWIDNIWERYRKAKGLKDDDPAYQQLMLDQCNEMWSLEPRNRGASTGTTDPGSGTTEPETGEFATNVRPFLDRTCAGCHGPIAPTAGMTLGGTGVSSKDIIAGIVGVKASNGEYALIEAGAPDRSWIYLKASGDVATVACSSACDRETMPPSGNGLTQAQLDSLRQWIMNGATDQ